MPKNILIFSDGTGQAGGLTPDENRSNIYKMYRATRCGPENDIDAKEQIAFYDPGLGTQPLQGSLFFRTWRWLHNIVSRATGLGITTNIIDCYSWLIRVYEPGDRIFLFGFSRGAYTVRCLATVLSLCGLPILMPDGKGICRDTGRSRVIAKEGVKRVYQFVSSPKDTAYLDQRDLLAKNFRQKYGSDNNGESNIAPFFIGVFDTVASLGSYRLSALLVVIFGMGLSVLSYLMSFFVLSFSTIFLSLSMISTIGALIWYAVEHIKFAKDLREYSWWNRWHLTSPKMKFSDLHLNKKVWYARHALSIDENRADFDRVIWGSNENSGPERPDEFPDWLKQVWFAGNHSDVGGGYIENEARLSDIALEWMIQNATNLPDEKTSNAYGIKVDKRFLHLNPDPYGPQHDECETGYFKYLWSKQSRKIQPSAILHPSVYQRFDAPDGAIHFYDRRPYRPINLSTHEKLVKYYKKT